MFDELRPLLSERPCMALARVSGEYPRVAFSSSSATAKSLYCFRDERNDEVVTVFCCSR